MDQAKLTALFKQFGVAADNPGVCLGPNQWRGGGTVVISTNPADEQPLARVATASLDAESSNAANSTRDGHSVASDPSGSSKASAANNISSNISAPGQVNQNVQDDEDWTPSPQNYKGEWKSGRARLAKNQPPQRVEVQRRAVGQT